MLVFIKQLCADIYIMDNWTFTYMVACLMWLGYAACDRVSAKSLST